MINIFITIFIAVLIGVSLVGPIAEQVTSAARSTNASNSACTFAVDSAYAPCALTLASSWGATILKMVPGFFALGILGIGIAVTYGALSDAGVV